MTTTSDSDNELLQEENIKYWREGAHLVIERPGGPGSDVEVEVRKNVFTDCGKFEEAARHFKKSILERLKGKRHHNGHSSK
ncbi:hypothetical protein Clacol_008058 [Clathrus columnatus]|uniref:Uncharacterized protein n=1 Tax=Clathrus columnatus TaxID=1419009 RepID=A0AAV5AGN9_9AGAM|nr:hypothetical protein Clacol_008058 [Clathrus columnatus]